MLLEELVFVEVEGVLDLLLYGLAESFAFEFAGDRGIGGLGLVWG
jgi:hypothetical protein